MSSIDVPIASDPQLPNAGGVNATSVPPTQQMAKNPQLPQHPLGAYTDAQYEAQNAALKSNIAKQYADILQQLGYIDPATGQFIQGSVETNANRQRGLLNRGMGIAREGVTKDHQLNGTLFSGLRGTDQARAEFPYTDELGQLDVNTPLTLSQLYERAAGLSGDYTLQDNQLLADAASRRAADMQQPGMGGAQADPVADDSAASGSGTYLGGDVATMPSGDPATGTGYPTPNIIGYHTPGLQSDPTESTTPLAPVYNSVKAPSAFTAPPAPAPPPLVQPNVSGISSAAQKKLVDPYSGNAHYGGVQF